MNGLEINCGPIDRNGKRLVILGCEQYEHRHRFDVDDSWQREQFRKEVVPELLRLIPLQDQHLKNGQCVDVQIKEEVESLLIEAADAADDGADSAWQPNSVSLDSVEPLRTDWLWDQYMPTGAITVLDGDPGLGKSQLTIDLAARLSRGDAMPPHTAADPTCTPRGTLFLNAEDDPARTLRPRLDAAGATMGHIHLLRSMDLADGVEQRPVTLPGDLPAIEGIIQEHNIGLVVVDPFVAYLDGQLNANSDGDVRRCLGQVATMAEKTGVSVLLVRHLNKKQGTNAKYRGGGSIGITGAARAVFVVGADPDDKDCRVLAAVKCNLAPEPPSLRFHIESVGTTSRIVWGDSCELSASDLLQTDKATGGSKCNQAKEIIGRVLANGPRGSNEVEQACLAAGISVSTCYRTRKSMGVRAEKTGFNDGQWLLTMPSTNGVPHESF